MKSLIFIPIVLLAAAGAAYGACRAAGKGPFGMELATAAIVVCIAADAALVPVMLVRKSDQAQVVQAALIGTIVHLFVSIVLAAVAYVAHLVADRNVFVFALLGFYWVSLIVLVISLVKILRAATPATKGGTAKTIAKPQQAGV